MSGKAVQMIKPEKLFRKGFVKHMSFKTAENTEGVIDERRL